MNLDRRLLDFIHSAPAAAVCTLVFGIGSGVAVIFQAKFLSTILDQVFLKNLNLASVWTIMVWFLGVVLVRAIFTLASDLYAKRLALKVKTQIRMQLFDKLFKLGPNFTEDEKTADLALTAVQGVEELDVYFSQYLPQLAFSALIPFSILLFTFPIDLISGLVFLFTAPLIPVFMILVGKRAEKLTETQWSTLSRLSSQFLDSLQGLSTIKAFNQGKGQAKKLAATNENYRLETMKVLQITFLSALVLEWVATLSTAVVAVQAGLRLLYGYISFPDAFFILLIAPELYLPLRTLGLRFHAGMTGLTAAKKIFMVLDKVSDEERGMEAIPEVITERGIPELPGEALLEFEAVSYRYRGKNEQAIDNISFAMGSGQKIALTGASGSGKSTLVKLLMRFIEPEMGNILFHGRPIQIYDLENWRTQLAWVPQQPVLFQGTIAENIALGLPGAPYEKIREAAINSFLDEWIEKQPLGYETQVGERGVQISGGQAQRIALARAFLKDAPILILDEPTSQLDPELEEILLYSTSQLCKERTVLTIAHRISTILQADKIIVLDKGKVIEKGSPDFLIKKQGTFYQMAARFQGEN